LIGEVLCAPEKSIIIIDEPEMHIHVSLIKHLFDLIEAERPDCAFIYLTHRYYLPVYFYCKASQQD
jgi:predicted ATP-dependent endonuclease of OLD family